MKGRSWPEQGLATVSAAGQAVCCPQEEGCPSTPDRLFKIVFVGNSAVGKTSFLRRFCEDRFSPGMTATVGESLAHLWEGEVVRRGPREGLGAHSGRGCRAWLPGWQGLLAPH